MENRKVLSPSREIKSVSSEIGLTDMLKRCQKGILQSFWGFVPEVFPHWKFSRWNKRLIWRTQLVFPLLMFSPATIFFSSKIQKYKIDLSKHNKFYFSFLLNDSTTRKNKHLRLLSSLESLKQFFVQFSLIQFLLFLYM